jgi:hypothetical protein
MKRIEHITHEKQDADAWVCLCGNQPEQAGFYPIDAGNHEVNPVPDEWRTEDYACRQCGRVIESTSLRVVRQLEVDQIVWLR